MTGAHVVEDCPELEQWRPRRAVWKGWREALGGRAVRKKEEEEEGDLLGAFFYRVYEFLFSFSNPPPIVHRPCVPARYAIKFVPATNLVISPIAPVITSSAASVASTDYSVVSSVNLFLLSLFLHLHPLLPFLLVLFLLRHPLLLRRLVIPLSLPSILFLLPQFLHLPLPILVVLLQPTSYVL